MGSFKPHVQTSLHHKGTHRHVPCLQQGMMARTYPHHSHPQGSTALSTLQAVEVSSLSAQSNHSAMNKGKL